MNRITSKTPRPAPAALRLVCVALLLAIGMPAAQAQLLLGSGLGIGISLSPLLSSGANASGTGSVAIGIGSLGSGTNAIAFGTNASATGLNSIALGSGSIDGGAANVVSIGNATTQRKLINLASGTLSLGSTDAVNGGQLVLTATALGDATASALGGGASYSLVGGVTAPSYLIRGSAAVGVGGAFTAVDTALGALQTSVNSNTTAVASLGTTVSGHTTQIGSNTTAIANLGTTVAGHTASIGAQASLISGHTTDIGNLNSLVAGQATQIGTNATAVANLGTTVAGHTSTLSAQAALISGHTTDIANLGTTVTSQGTLLNTHTTALANLGTTVSGHTTTLNAQAALISGNTSDIGNLNALVSTQATQIGANTGAIATINGTLLSQGAQIGTHTTAIAANTAAIAANAAAITANTNTLAGDLGAQAQLIAGNTSTLSAQGALISGNTSDIASLGATVGNHTAQIALNTSGLSNLGSTVAGHTAQIGANAAGLQVANARIDTNTASLDAQLTLLQGLQSTSANAVQYDNTLKDSVTFGGTLGTTLNNVAAGALNASSTQAVNGSQLFATNQQVAANTAQITLNANGLSTLSNQVATGGIGLVRQAGPTQDVTVGAATGGAAVDFTGLAGARLLSGVAAGTVALGSQHAINGGQLWLSNQQIAANTAGIAALSTSISQLGNGGPGGIAATNDSGLTVPAASGADSTAVGYGAAAGGNGSVAVGSGATSTGAGSVALGQGASDDGQAQVVSVGSAAQRRRLIHVADGVDASDAATMGQLATVDGRVNDLSNRAVMYDFNHDGSINYGSVSLGSNTAPVRVRNVAAGQASTDAVNIGQLQSLAGAIGGGMQWQGTAFTAPEFSVANVDANMDVGTSSVNTVAAAFSSLSDSLARLTAATRARIGAASGNVTHVTTVNNVVQDGPEMYMNVNSSMPDSVAAGTDSMAFGPQAEALGDRSVAFGVNASAQSASAVAIGDAAVARGGRAVSVGAGNIATGNGAVAIGDPNVATGTGAVAIGDENTATGTGAVALGNLNVATGTGSVAIGNQSSAGATGSVAMGNTAVASVAGGVALGSGSVANRAGMNGAVEAISGVAVASTQGAVSVGSAGNERQITNVAGGTEDTDAVNLRQLRAAQATAVQTATAAMDERLNQVVQTVDRVQRNASAGTAAAMAMAGMPQTTVPGKGMLAAGAGTYSGQSAIALGFSVMSDTGRWIAKLNASANTRGQVGVSAGVGFQW